MSWKFRYVAPVLLARIMGLTAEGGLATGQSLNLVDPDKRPTSISKPAAALAPEGEDAVQAEGDFELGAGDVIHISIWREPELSETAVVRPDGRVSLPLAGEVPVAGKTALNAQSRIRSLLLKYVANPQVTVSVVEIHSRQVFITGQVQRPGAYPLLGSCSVLQLIASSGGLTPYAHKKHIVVLDSDNRPIAQFDYASAIKGDPRQGRMLQPGETVVVP
jgi:polysaccharide export outer membrane protein